jgi:hypothetical protein
MQINRIVAAAIVLGVLAGACYYITERSTDGAVGALADSASPRRGSCSAKPNTPDGPDPWGGCFPGPQTTGVPAGYLTPYTGPCRITEANTVIDAKTVNCAFLEIFAPHVQIRNSLINGSVWVDSPTQGGSFAITDSTVDAGDVGGTAEEGKSSIGKSHFVALRVETLGGIRGIWCEYECTVKDSWVHGQDKDESGVAHESGVRMGSGTAGAGQHFVHNTIVCDAPNVPPDAGCSADVTGYGDFATIQNNTVTNNLLGSSTGGTCAYGGSSPDKPYPDGNNNIFKDNIFQRGPGNRGSGALGHCGYWYAIVDLTAGQRGNQWVNNRWDNGMQMPADG